MTWEGILKDFMRYLKLERGLSENTLMAYRRDIEKLAHWSIDNEIAPDSIQLESIRKFLTDQKQLSARSQARLITSIKTLYRFLIYDDAIQEDPTALLEAPKLGRKLPDYLNEDEVDSMITQIDRSTLEGERNRAILEVLFACGLRVSELINLRLSDYFPKDGILRVFGKGDKERLVPIHPYAVEVLEYYVHQIRIHMDVKYGEEDIVFLSKRGKRMGRSTVFTIIKDLAERAGITKNIGPHTFRHSFATALVNNGADLRIVQQLLGHESITTTEIYSHLEETKLREAIESHPWMNNRPTGDSKS